MKTVYALTAWHGHSDFRVHAIFESEADGEVVAGLLGEEYGVEAILYYREGEAPSAAEVLSGVSPA